MAPPELTNNPVAKITGPISETYLNFLCGRNCNRQVSSFSRLTRIRPGVATAVGRNACLGRPRLLALVAVGAVLVAAAAAAEAAPHDDDDNGRRRRGSCRRRRRGRRHHRAAAAGGGLRRRRPRRPPPPPPRE